MEIDFSVCAQCRCSPCSVQLFSAEQQQQQQKLEFQRHNSNSESHWIMFVSPFFSLLLLFGYICFYHVCHRNKHTRIVFIHLKMIPVHETLQFHSWESHVYYFFFAAFVDQMLHVKKTDKKNHLPSLHSIQYTLTNKSRICFGTAFHNVQE